MKITKKQLYLYVKINFLILFFIIVLFLMYHLRKKGLPHEVEDSLQLPQRPAQVLPHQEK